MGGARATGKACLNWTRSYRCERHRRVLVVAGRSKRFVREEVGYELKQLVEEQHCTGHEMEMVRNTIGDVGAAFVMAPSQSGVIVVQAVPESVAEV